MLPCASIRARQRAFNFSPIRCELAEPATLSAAEGSYSSFPAEVAELADAPDSKSGGAHAPCGFDSHLRHSVMEMRGPSPKAGFARREARGRLRRHKHKTVESRHGRREAPAGLSTAARTRGRFDRAGRSP